MNNNLLQSINPQPLQLFVVPINSGNPLPAALQPLQLLISFPLLIVQVLDILLLVLYGTTTIAQNILLTVQEVLQANILTVQVKEEAHGSLLI